HPRSVRPRHLVPPVAVAGAAVAPVLAAWPAGRKAVTGGAVAYAALAAAAVASSETRRHGASAGVMAACFPVMHMAWGAGFLVTFVRGEPVRPTAHATLNP